MRTTAPDARIDERTPSRLPAFLVTGLLLLPVVAFAAPAASAAEPSPDDPMFLARFRSASVVPSDDELELRGARVLYRFHAIPAVLLAGPEDVVRSFEVDPRVEYVERDSPVDFFMQTATFATNAADVWGEEWWPVAAQVQRKDPSPIVVDGEVIDGSGVTVGVIDTGINGLHPDLWYAPLHAAPMPWQPKLLVCTNVPGLITPEPHNPDCDQTIGHGTHVAGIVAGTGWAARQGLAQPFVSPNAPPLGAAPGAMLAGAGLGVGESLVGVAGGILFTDVALDWMHDNAERYGIQVVTNSWGTTGSCSGNFVSNSITELTDALVRDRDIVVLFAAGNEVGSNLIVSPYSVNPTPGVLSVANYDDLGAGTRAGRVNPGSSNGCTATGANNPTGKDHIWTWPDVAAPGTNILSTSAYSSQLGLVGGALGGSIPFYSVLSGTSMATPHVAGIVALMRQANPELTAPEIERILVETSTRWTDGVADQGRSGTVMWNADPDLCHVTPADAAKARAGDTSVNAKFPRFTELAQRTDPDLYVCRDFKRGVGLVDAYASVMRALDDGPEGAPLVKIQSPSDGAEVPAAPLEVAGFVDRAATGTPSASIEATPDSGTVPLDVTFTLAASDADGALATWSLDLGDGSPAQGGPGAPPATVQHTYAAAGTYTATLAVTDDEGLVGTDAAVVTATATSNGRVLWLVGDGTSTTVTQSDLATVWPMSPTSNGGLLTTYTTEGSVWNLNQTPDNLAVPTWTANFPVTLTGEPLTLRLNVEYLFDTTIVSCRLAAHLLDANGGAIAPRARALVTPTAARYDPITFTFHPVAGTYANGVTIQVGAVNPDCGAPPQTWAWGDAAHNGRLVLGPSDTGGGPGPLAESLDPVGDAAGPADVVGTDLSLEADALRGTIRLAEPPSPAYRYVVVVDGVEFDALLHGGLLADGTTLSFSLPDAVLGSAGAECVCEAFVATKVVADGLVEDYAPDSPGVVVAEGDVGTDPAEDARLPGFDITGMSVHDETTSSFQVTLRVRDLAAAPDSTFSLTGLPPPFVQRPIPFGAENVYSVAFDYTESDTNRVRYALQAARYFLRADTSGTLQQAYTGFVLSTVGGSQFTSVASITGTWDAPGGRITWVVPKAVMKVKTAPTSATSGGDLTSGSPPTAGKLLDGFTADARTWFWAGAGSGPSAAIWDSAAGTATYTITGGNPPPIASITATPSVGAAPLAVTFALSASDADGVASWSLDLGDATPPAGGAGAPPATFPHTYTASGAYTATFVVTDTLGASTTKTASVDVGEAGGERVELHLDGGLTPLAVLPVATSDEDPTESWSGTVDLRGLVGTHTVVARWYDGATLLDSDSVTVELPSAAPHVEIHEPIADAIVTGTVPVSGLAGHRTVEEPPAAPPATFASETFDGVSYLRGTTTFDFESGTAGWAVVNEPLAAGGQQLADSRASAKWHRTQRQAGSAAWGWYAGSEEPGVALCFCSYNPGIRTNLVSPTIPLADASAAKIDFLLGGDSATGDALHVQWKPAAAPATAWATLPGGTFTEDNLDGDFNPVHVARSVTFPAQALGQDVVVRFRFQTQSDPDVLLQFSWGYFLDRVVVTTVTGPAVPPTAPVSLVATPGVESVTLSWLPPLDPGSAPVEGYRVYRDGALVATLTGASHVEAGLTAIREYVFEVSAFSEAGEGPRAVASATPQARPPDTGLAITEPTDGSTGLSGDVVLRGTYGPGDTSGDEPRVVVAVIDNGINPYHAHFYEGSALYPSGDPPSAVTPELLQELGIDAAHQVRLTRTGNWAADRNADTAVWNAIAADRGSLWWFVGTNIVATSKGATSGQAILADPSSDPLDSPPHGTGTTSSVLNANPEAVVLFVEGPGDASEAFAFSHPAVDIVSTSYGPVGSVPLFAPLAGGLQGVLVGGKLHFGAADNSPAVATGDSTAGPWWSIGVAGWEDTTHGKQIMSGTGADFVADFTQDLPYCIDCETGTDDFVTGTSFATPTSAGVASKVLLEARRAAGHLGGIDRTTTPAAMVVDEATAATVTNWDLRRALEEGAVYESIADWDPFAATVGEAMSFPPLDATPWATVGWGVLTSSSAVVDEALRHLAGNPTRSKPLEACAYMSALHEARHAWWDVIDGTSAGEDDLYRHCLDEPAGGAAAFPPLAESMSAELEDREDAATPSPFDILAVDLHDDDEYLYATWDLSLLISGDETLVPEAQNAWYDVDFKVGDTEYVLEVAGDLLFGDGGLGYAPTLYTANGGTFATVEATTTFDFDWENDRFTVGVLLSDVGLASGGLVDNTWASTWPMNYAQAWDKVPDAGRRASQGGAAFGEDHVVEAGDEEEEEPPAGTEVKIDLDGPEGFTDVAGALATLATAERTWSWDPAGTLPAGAYTATAREYLDGALVRGPASSSFAVGGTVDVVPPVITDVLVTTTPTSATVTWTTSEPATGLVRYGTTAAYGSTASGSGFVTSHSVTIEDLAPSTTYHFQVESVDAAANAATTPDATFDTLESPPVGDTVEIFLDGTTLLATLPVDTTTGDDAWATPWDTTAAADGAHTLTAVFTDAEGRQATATVAVHVDNAANHAPVFLEQDDVTVTETDRVEFVVVATDQEGDPLTYTAPERPTGSVFFGNQRRFAWTPGNNDAGDHVVRFVVTDGELTDTMEVTIHVVDKPRKPKVDAQSEPTSASEGSRIGIATSAFDPDGDPVALTANGLPDGASFTDHGDGTGLFEWEPTYAQAGSYAFQVTATSPDGLSDTAEFSLTVLEGVAPVVVGETARGFPTVAAAVAAAAPGQTVVVAPGTYAERIVVATEGVTVCAGPAGALECGPTVQPVVLDGSGAAGEGSTDVVRVEADGVTLRGLTVQYLGTVPADGVTGIALGTSRGTTVDGVTVRLQGGGCVPDAIPAGCPSPNRVFGITAADALGAPGTRILGSTITAHVASDDGTIGGVDGVRGMLPGGVLADNDVEGWASNGALVWGDGLVVDGNSFRLDGTGLAVCTGDFGLDGVTVVNNEFRATLAAVALTGCRPGTGVEIHDNQMGLTNGVALELRPSTTALDVDATCNDWGVYSTDAIRTRIRDDGGSNEVAVAPFTSRETGVAACLLPPEAAFAASATEASRGEAVAFDDESVAGTRAIVAREWTFGDGTRSALAAPTHAYRDVGTYAVTLRVEDAAGLVSTATGHVTVTNAAPVLAAVGDRAGRTGERLEFVVAATDPDGDALALSAQGLPSGATFEPATGRFAWTPTWAQSGTFPVTFVADDGLATDSETLDLVIAYVNRAPVLSTVGDRSALTGQALAFSLRGADPDGDRVTYSAVGLPAGATLGTTTGAFAWRPTASQAGTHTMTFRASDGSLADTEEVRIFVSTGAGHFTVVPVRSTPYDTSPGKAVTVSFHVRNVGETPDVVDLAADAPAAWSPVLSHASVSLAPGQVATVTIKVVPTTKPLESQVTLVGTSAVSGRAQSASTVRVPVVVAVALDRESYGVSTPVTGRVTMTYLDGTPAAGQSLQIGESYAIAGLQPVGGQRHSTTVVGPTGTVAFALPVNPAGANMPGHHQLLASAVAVVSDRSAMVVPYLVAR